MICIDASSRCELHAGCTGVSSAGGRRAPAAGTETPGPHTPATCGPRHPLAAVVCMVYIMIPCNTAPLLQMSPSSSVIHKTAPSPSTYIPAPSASTVHAPELNRPLQLLATVAMCNVVELHLALALQTRMTNHPSRSALKALGEASGAA